jgi:hypothetical protein
MNCSWCGLGLPLDNMEGVVIDHIIPIARGGPNKRWNKQLLHDLCNTRKSDQLTPQAEALAAKYGVKLHEPAGRIRYQMSRQYRRPTAPRPDKRPLMDRPEMRELKRLTDVPPSLAELQVAIDAVLGADKKPMAPGARWVAAEMARRARRQP